MWCQTSTLSIRIPGVPRCENFSTEATGLLTTPPDPAGLLTTPPDPADLVFNLYDPTRVS